MTDIASEAQAPAERVYETDAWAVARGKPAVEEQPERRGSGLADRLEGLVSELGDSLSDSAVERAFVAYENYNDPGDAASALLDAVGPADARFHGYIEMWAEDDPAAASAWLAESEQASFESAQAYGQAAEESRRHAEAQRLAAAQEAYIAAVGKVEKEDPALWERHGSQLAALISASPELLGAVRADPVSGVRFALRTAAEADAARSEAAFRDEARQDQWRKDNWIRTAATPERPEPVDAADFFDPTAVVRAEDVESVDAYKRRLFAPHAARDTAWDRSQARLGALPNRAEERAEAGRSAPVGAFGQKARVAPHAGRTPLAPAQAAGARRPPATSSATSYWDNQAPRGPIPWNELKAGGR